MAVRVGGIVGGVPYVASSTYASLVPLPTIVSTTDDTPANGSELTLTVINASAAGNAIFLTDGTTIVEQAVTAEYENEISITVDRGPFKYGVDLFLYIVDAEYLQGPDYTVQLTPQTGWSYVNLGTLAPPEERIEAVEDLAPGDQLAWDTRGGIVFVRVDASYYATSGEFDSFSVEAWSPGEGWGEIGEQALFVEIPLELSLELTALASTVLPFDVEGGVEPAMALLPLELVPIEFAVTSGVEIPVDVAFELTELALSAETAVAEGGRALFLELTDHVVATTDFTPETGNDLPFAVALLEVAALPFAATAGQPVDITLELTTLSVSPLASAEQIGQDARATVTDINVYRLTANTETGNDVAFERRALGVYPIAFTPYAGKSDPIEAAFRLRYPEFADLDRWPYELVSTALCEARGEIGKRWGKYAECSLHQRGLFAYAAHWLVMREAARKAASAGAIPATPSRTASKTVGGESVSYHMGQYTSYSAGDDVLASTVYGAEFLRLRKRAGMGALAL